LRRVALACVALALALAPMGAAHAELKSYQVVGDAIPESLTGANGDPAKGRAIVANRQVGLCLLCHSGPFPEERFQGTLAPDLRLVGGAVETADRRFGADQSGDHHAAILPDRWSDPGGARVRR
jgi:sulfur-oxidizing protein SoxX